MIEIATVKDVNRLAEVIEDDWSLCKLFDGRKRAKEAEVMVAQTIHAARMNASTDGEPFSYKGKGLNNCSGGGIVDNATAYAMLINEEFLVENERKNKTVIFPTQKLIELLDEFFLMKESAKKK